MRMLGYKPAKTPMESNAKLGIRGREVEQKQYQWLVWKLIFLSHIRPDITFVVNVVSQCMYAPKEKHLEVVYKIPRYLKNTPGKGPFFFS